MAVGDIEVPGGEVGDLGGVREIVLLDAEVVELALVYAGLAPVLELVQSLSRLERVVGNAFDAG